MGEDLHVEARQMTLVECMHCHREVTRVMSTIAQPDGSTFAVCFASLHEAGEAWIDAIVGTFGEGAPPDHVTFGCHIVFDRERKAPVIHLVDAAAPFAYRPIMGRVLGRVEALAHERLDDFWRVVDLVLLNDPVVSKHIYQTT